MQLPESFTHYTRQLMGEERFSRYLQSFCDETPVSIRLNPLKAEGLEAVGALPVAWCRDGYYLPRRPNFTMDPLLHAGCYYVQEAASMFLDEVLRQHAVGLLSPNGCCLDLCAAPGGKSTLLRAVLPPSWGLYSNEPVRQRCSILCENVSKWGWPNHVVTNNYPRDYRRSGLHFDVIVCDVPCSGEGMFRKDEATIREWSLQQVERCWQLQRDIVDDAWACLNEGGLLIYSTCTFNTKENEENVRYFLEHYDAEALSVAVQPEWHITGSLLEGFTAPVYRFIPGITRSEGLFMCALRKGRRKARVCTAQSQALRRAKWQSLRVQSADASTPSVGRAELDYLQALAYLRGEAVMLPADTPRGIVDVCFMGHPLGQAKNIGSRANNLYPKPWRIKTTHIPTDYEAILRHS